MEMQPEWNLDAAQFVTWWAQKFALQLTWLPFQLAVCGMVERMLEMVEAILQTIVVAGCWSANVTLRESPSKIKEDNPNELAKRAARRAAVASPKRAKHGVLISEIHLIIEPVEFLQTAAWAENVALIAVS
jgi:hypothetical protein